MTYTRLLTSPGNLKLKLAVIACVSGCLGGLSVLPIGAPLRVILLGFFVLVGIGCAAVAWIDGEQEAVLWAIPVLGLSIMIGLTTILLWLEIWNPSVVTLLGSVVVFASGLLRLRKASLSPFDSYESEVK